MDPCTRLVNPVRPRWWVSTLAVVFAAVAFPSGAVANGRFPLANFLVVGPGAGSGVLALRATFGLLLSQDAGRSWHWVCEPALVPDPLVDPPVALGSTGTVVVGVNTGLVVSDDQCAWRTPPGDPGITVTDVAQDATGTTVVAAGSTMDGVGRLTLSADGGRTWRPGASLAGVLVLTVEVAPGNPRRVYVTGNLLAGATVVYRSEDGGMTAREISRSPTAATELFLGAVASNNPDVVYIRTAEQDGGSTLLRSDDGGAHWATVGHTVQPMMGFALSDDASTVWIGSLDTQEGVLRSVHGGPFTPVGGTLPVRCLRYHAGVLYACADELSAAYSLARSTDDGEHFTPVMALRDVAGPLACPAGSSVTTVCSGMWPGQMALFPTHATGSDGGVDAGPPARDAAMDVTADGSPRSPTVPVAATGCACAVPTGNAVQNPVHRTGDRDATGAMAVMAVVSGFRRRRPAGEHRAVGRELAP